MREEDRVEIAKQLDIWAGAYKNIGKLSSDVASLSLRIQELQESIEGQSAIQDGAMDIINALVESMEDTEENREELESIMAERLGRVLVEGFLK